MRAIIYNPRNRKFETACGLGLSYLKKKSKKRAVLDYFYIESKPSKNSYTVLDLLGYYVLTVGLEYIRTGTTIANTKYTSNIVASFEDAVPNTALFPKDNINAFIDTGAIPIASNQYAISMYDKLNIYDPTTKLSNSILYTDQILTTDEPFLNIKKIVEDLDSDYIETNHDFGWVFITYYFYGGNYSVATERKNLVKFLSFGYKVPAPETPEEEVLESKEEYTIEGPLHFPINNIGYDFPYVLYGSEVFKQRTTSEKNIIVLFNFNSAGTTLYSLSEVDSAFEITPLGTGASIVSQRIFVQNNIGDRRIDGKHSFFTSDLSPNYYVVKQVFDYLLFQYKFNGSSVAQPSCFDSYLYENNSVDVVVYDKENVSTQITYSLTPTVVDSEYQGVSEELILGNNRLLERYDLWRAVFGVDHIYDELSRFFYQGGFTLQDASGKDYIFAYGFIVTQRNPDGENRSTCFSQAALIAVGEDVAGGYKITGIDGTLLKITKSTQGTIYNTIGMHPWFREYKISDTNKAYLSLTPFKGINKVINLQIDRVDNHTIVLLFEGVMDLGERFIFDTYEFVSPSDNYVGGQNAIKAGIAGMVTAEDEPKYTVGAWQRYYSDSGVFTQCYTVANNAVDYFNPYVAFYGKTLSTEHSIISVSLEEDKTQEPAIIVPIVTLEQKYNRWNGNAMYEL